MFKPQRLVMATIDEILKKQQENKPLSLGEQRILATSPTEQGGGGFASLAASRVAPETTKETTKGLEDKIAATEFGAGEMPTEETPEGDIYQIQPDGTRKLIRKGYRTPLRQSQERATKLREELKRQLLLPPGAEGKMTAEQVNLLQEEALRSEEANAPNILKEEARRMEQERGALEKNIARREEQIRTGEGEAGQRIASQTAAAQSGAFRSPEAPTSSTTPGIQRRIQVSGERALSEALASDPLIQQFRNRLTGTIGKEGKIEEAKKSISKGEFDAIQKFFADLEAQDLNLKAQEATNLQTQAKDNLKLLQSQPPAVWAAYTPEEAGNLYKDAGLSYSAGIAYQGLQSRLSTELAKGDKANPDVVNNLKTQLGIVVKETETAKRTTAQQNFDYLVGLEASGYTPTQIQAFKDFAGAGNILDAIRANLLQTQIKEQNLKNTELERNLGLDAGTFGFSVTPPAKTTTRADINNNPGNLKVGGTTDSAGFTVFNNPEEGFQAMINDITSKVTGSSPQARKKLGKDASTLYEMIQVYAPVEDGNDPLNYANKVAEKLNIKYDTPVALLKSRIPELAKAMAEHEGYNGTISVGTATRLNEDQQDLVSQALNGDRSIKDIQSTLPAKDKAKVAAEFGRQLQELASKETNPVKRNMILSLGKSDPAQGESKILDKTFDVATQLKYVMDKVQEMVDKGAYGLGPIEGRIQSLNPYADDYVELEALLQGLTPGVARGIFGEVGVLTDNDIALYKKVIGSPLNTVSQIKEQQKNLQKKLYQSFEGYMNSATYNTFQRMPEYDSIVNSLSPEAKKELGLNLSPDNPYSESNVNAVVSPVVAKSYYNNLPIPPTTTTPK